MFFVKKRFFRRYETKKKLLVVFLVFVNMWIWWNVSKMLPEVDFSLQWHSDPIIVENHATFQNLKPSEVVATEKSTEDKIRETFGENWKIALAIAKSESGLRPVKGDQNIEFIQDGQVMGHSCGIFQIRVLKGRPNCEALMDEDTNIAYAKRIYDRVGFTAWSNYKNGRYLAFLEN